MRAATGRRRPSVEPDASRAEEAERARSDARRAQTEFLRAQGRLAEARGIHVF